MCQFDMQSRANAFKKYAEKKNLDLENKVLTPLRNMENYEKCIESYNLKSFDYFEYMQYIDDTEHYLTLFLNKKTATTPTEVSKIILGNYSLMLRSVQCNLGNRKTKNDRINKLATANFARDYLLKRSIDIYKDYQTKEA